MTAPTLPNLCRCDLPVRHPLTADDLADLNAELYAAGITVRVEGPDRDSRVVVLHPALSLSTAQQVHAVWLVKQRTDAPVRWVGA